MEKLFKDFITQEITAFLREHSDWRPAPAPKGHRFPKGSLWKRVNAQGRVVVVHCSFWDKLNSTELYLGWSANGDLPSIDDVMAGRTWHDIAGDDKNAGAVNILTRSECGWLRQVHLKLPEMFGLTVEVPPLSRLESVFDDPKNAKEVDAALIQGSPYANWREATPFHFWGMVDHFDPLTLEDARVAVGGTRNALIGVLTQHYLPIADRYLAAGG